MENSPKNTPECGALVYIRSLKPRFGQPGLLHWSDDTDVSVRLEPRDAGMQFEFPYAVGTSHDFATMTFVYNNTSLGGHVSLPFCAMTVVPEYTQKQEPYLRVEGLDTEGKPIGVLRMWRFEEDDLVEGGFYILRGLKVVAETHWDYYSQSYAVKENGARAFECTQRTAAEDVSLSSVVKAFWT